MTLGDLQPRLVVLCNIGGPDEHGNTGRKRGSGKFNWSPEEIRERRRQQRLEYYRNNRKMLIEKAKARYRARIARQAK